MTTTRVSAWQEPARGSFANPAVVALPGIEQLGHFLSGRSPRPPIARLVGRRLVDIGHGTTTMTMPASDWILGPKGRVHTGMLVLLADAPLLCAVQSTLPPYTFCTTAELSMTFLGPAPAGGGTLSARARLIHVDGRNGLAEAFIEDGAGTLVAHATSRCFVFRPPGAPDPSAAPESVELEETVEPAYADPDPHLRPADGVALDAEVMARYSGLELLRAQASGALPLPPVHHLTGIRPVSAERGRAVFAMPAGEWLRNEFGRVFGGAVGFLAKSSVAGAVQTLAAAGTSYTALDVKVNFLRPLDADGADLVATGTVVHSGRKLAIAT
ncbi:MAG TPA: PaaI family thioesterase, partial [Candidatus Dormibacteraeota bacterium]